MNIPQMKGLIEKLLDEYKRRLENTKNYLKQVSQILEKKTYLQGGWPEEFWLDLKKRFQAEIKNLKQSIETLEKFHTYS